MDAGEHHAAGSGGRRVYLETFGCQMNELDSELVRGQMAALGYAFTGNPRQADVILYNTCSVREHAESKSETGADLFMINAQVVRPSVKLTIK